MKKFTYKYNIYIDNLHINIYIYTNNIYNNIQYI